MCHSGIRDHKVRIKTSNFITKNMVSMCLETNTIDFKPGQFLMLEVPNTALRRPFVIVDKNKESIKIIFKIKGKGTKLLSELKTGTELKALAPLGNIFPEPPQGYKPLLVGGGIGIVTLLPLAKKLSSKCLAEVVLGADTAESLILLDEFDKCSNINICTDDGSKGEKCNSVALAKKQITQSKEKFIIYACGPNPMLKAISELSKELTVPCFISLEERMGCGVGACVCCVTKTTNGLKRVCKDGPVFDAQEIIWEP